MKLNVSLKRITTMVLIATLLTGMVIPASAKYFSDTPSDYWAVDGINYVSDNGIMKGTTSTTFDPNGSVTRGMIAMVLYNMEGNPYVSGTSGFSDVSNSAYYSKAITWVKNAGIMNGVGDNLFSPNANIIRQDAACVFYRYANYKKENTTKTVSLSGYTDVSQVSSYALSAVKWNVATGVLTGTEQNILEPKSTLTRAQIAVIVTRYRTNVEKVKSGRDNYSFSNSSNYFTNSSYYITDSQFNALISYAQNYYPNNNSLVQKLKDYRNRSWGGSCYGMSVTCILDKLGKIDLNGNYSNAKTMYGINGNTIRGTAVEGAINYYHLSQLLPPFQHNAYNVSKDNLSKLVSDMNKTHGISLFSYWWNENGSLYGHSIVAYDMKQDSAGNYLLSAYDCRYPFIKTTITISADYSTCTVQGGRTETASYVELATDFSEFSKIDIDHAYNNNPTFATETNAVSLNNNTTFSVALFEAFALRNSQGEMLKWDGKQLSGNIDIVDYYMTTEGDTQASTLVLTVPDSDKYELIPSSENSKLYVTMMNDTGYIRVSGQNISALHMNADTSVQIDGDNVVYEAAYGANEENAPLYTESGTGSEIIVNAD